MGSITNSNSIFILPISNELKYSRAELSFIYSLYSLGQVCIALLADIIFKKYKIKYIMGFSSLLIGICTFFMSFSNHILEFYINALFIGLGIGGLCSIPVALLIKKFFSYNYGFILGIVMSGSGIGGMLFNYLFLNTISSITWRKTYLIISIIHIFFLFPLIICILKNIDIIQEKKSEKLTYSFIKNFNFWLFGLASFFSYSLISSIFQIIVPYLKDINYQHNKIIFIASSGMISLTFGKIILGKIYDYTNPLIGTLFCSICGIITTLSLIFINHFRTEYIFILFSGIAYSFGTITYPIVTSSLFSKKYFIKINGIYNAIGGIALAFGSFFTSLIYNIYNSYIFALQILLGLSIISIFIYLKIIPNK